MGYLTFPLLETSAAWRTLRAFSLYQNVPRIINARHAPGSYTCLHGVRVILAAWIVLGHTFFVGVTWMLTPINNATGKEGNARGGHSDNMWVALQIHR